MSLLNRKIGIYYLKYKLLYVQIVITLRLPETYHILWIKRIALYARRADMIQYMHKDMIGLAPNKD